MLDFDKMNILEDCSVNSSSFLKLKDRLKHNERISDYYNLLHKERLDSCYDSNFDKKSFRVANCAQLWKVAWHKNLKVKELQESNLCRDKFCLNCQSALSKAREHKYAPLLDECSKSHSIYHCVFTVPNCCGDLLHSTVRRMYKSFSYFLQYLSGKRKIKGLDFSRLGFVGVIKSLETTYNSEFDTYHPHLHVLMVMSKGLVFEKVIVNKFSYSREHGLSLFSPEEILFQNIWYLLNNGIRVTLDNIDSVSLGYDVHCSLAEPGDYKEIFKYPFKGNFNEDKCLEYVQFCVFLKQLKRVRHLSGHGIFYKLSFEDDDYIQDDLELSVRELCAELEEFDPSYCCYESASEVVKNLQVGEDVYITGGSMKKFYMSSIEDRLTDESKEILEQIKAKVESRER